MYPIYNSRHEKRFSIGELEGNAYVQQIKVQTQSITKISDILPGKRFEKKRRTTTAIKAIHFPISPLRKQIKSLAREDNPAIRNTVAIYKIEDHLNMLKISEGRLKKM